MYSDIQNGTIVMFEDVCYIVDDTGEESTDEAMSVPWYILLKKWIIELFSKTRNHYSQILALGIDEDGFLFETTSRL